MKSARLSKGEGNEEEAKDDQGSNRTRGELKKTRQPARKFDTIESQEGLSESSVRAQNMKKISDSRELKLTPTSHTSNMEAACPENVAEESSLKEWSDFRPHLNPRTLGAIHDFGWATPTLVQCAVIPLLLEGRDMMVHAPTGSGKTAAFLIPLVELLLRERFLPQPSLPTPSEPSIAWNNANPSSDHKVMDSTHAGVSSSVAVALRCVILVPSAELSRQTLGVIKGLTKYMASEFHFQELAPFDRVIANSLWGPSMAHRGGWDILVATPAVLFSHVRNEPAAASAFQSTRYIVIDEADSITSMVSMNHLKSFFPVNAQTVMVSATLGRVVQELRTLYLRKPVVVSLEDDDDDDQDATNGEKEAKSGKESSHQQQRIIENFVTVQSRQDRYTYLYAILRTLISKNNTRPRKCLIFVANTHTAYSVKIFLESFDIESFVVHPDIPKESREHILTQFNAATSGQLVACDEGEDGSLDLAGGYGIRRGIDFHNITHVLIFNCKVDTTSSSLSAYVQRIGRTGRAHKKGTSILFLTPDEVREVLPTYQLDCTRRTGRTISCYPDIDLTMVCELRYRCSDVMETITKKRVNSMKVKDIAAQILNCEKLQFHFQRHEKDQATLKDLISRDKVARQRASALTCVPFYMKTNETVSTTMSQQPAGSAPEQGLEPKRCNKSKRSRSTQDPLAHYRLQRKRTR